MTPYAVSPADTHTSGLPHSLQWRHNKRDGVSNNQPHDCLLNRLFRRRSKKTSKLRVTGLCGGNSPVTGEFPAQRASNTENISIWWRHHVTLGLWYRLKAFPRVFVFDFALVLASQFDITCQCRADSGFAPSQWETALLCNDVSHWLCARLELAMHCFGRFRPPVWHISADTVPQLKTFWQMSVPN